MMQVLAATPFQAAQAHQQHLPGLIVLGFLQLRVFLGVTDNLAGTGLSELALLGFLAALLGLCLYRCMLALPVLPVLAGFALWLALGLISIMANDLPAPQNAYRQFALLMLYALALNQMLLAATEPRFLPLVSRFLAGFVLLGGLLSFYQIATGTGFVAEGRSDILRAYGPDVHPVSWALQLVIALTGIEALRRVRGKPLNGFVVALYAIGLAALYLSFSRTGWAMLALVVLFSVAAGARGALRPVLILCLGAAVLGFFALSPRFSDLAGVGETLRNYDFTAQSYNYNLVDNSFSWRLVNWGQALTLAKDNLMIGVGPGQSSLSSQFDLKMHNLFLEAVVEVGAFGLLAVGMVLGGLLALHRAIPEGSWRAPVSALGAGMLLSVLFSTSMIEQSVTILLYFLVLAAMQGARARP